MNVIDDNARRFPGTHIEYSLWMRKASERDPNGWKMIGKPTTEHQTLRDMVMPQDKIDSKLYGVNWIDQFNDVEYKLMERTVTRTEWRIESKSRESVV